eukprot:10457051-Alexandrium_andersonii.AAC.1
MQLFEGPNVSIPALDEVLQFRCVGGEGGADRRKHVRAGTQEGPSSESPAPRKWKTSGASAATHPRDVADSCDEHPAFAPAQAV